jgi:hypothetical protein
MQMHTMKMQRHQPMQLWWPWHTKVASFQMGLAPAPAASPESQRGPQQIRHPNAAQSPGHGLGRGKKLLSMVKGSKGYITRFYHYPFW